MYSNTYENEFSKLYKTIPFIYSSNALFFQHLPRSQIFDFQFDCEWKSAENRCVTCSYDDFTQTTLSSATKQIKVSGKYDFTYLADAVVYQ